MSATGPGLGASVRRAAETCLPTAHGEFRLIAYDSAARGGGEPHLALVMGSPEGAPPPLVRLHSECLTGDALGSIRCDCGRQLDCALALVADERRGVVLYLRQEGRGVGLLDKLRAYALQDRGRDTVEANEELGLPADARDYRVAAAILRDLGVERLRLLTNNPRKVEGLRAAGLTVARRLPLVVAARAENSRYLATKREKMGHLLDRGAAADPEPRRVDEEPSDGVWQACCRRRW